MNLYTYVYNNPTRYHDPSGNIPVLVALIGKQLLNYGLDVMIGVGTDYLDHLNTKSGTFNVKASIKKNAKESIVPGLGFLKKVKKAYKLADGINDALKKAKKAKGKGKNVVYTSRNANDVVQYVGITNNYARRAAEHLRDKGINIQPLMKNLSRSDARAVEQALIEIHGLQKNGGTLLNKINSISTKNPSYAQQLERGYKLLKSIGY